MFGEHAKPRGGTAKFSSDDEKIFVVTKNFSRGGEMVDAPALGAGGATRGGSSPLLGTQKEKDLLKGLFLFVCRGKKRKLLCVS